MASNGDCVRPAVFLGDTFRLFRNSRPVPRPGSVGTAQPGLKMQENEMPPNIAILTAPIGPTIIRLAAPNMIAMFITLLTLVAEAWYVGRLGTASLAGLALAFPMMMLMQTLSGGSIGGSITGAVAQRLGAGDRAGAEALAFHALLLAVLLAALSALLFLIGGRSIYTALGGSGAVLEQALAYSNVLFAGCVTMWLANSCAAIVRATGNMKVAATHLVVGSVVQVVAAAVLIFGVGPVSGMGIAGAAAGIGVGYATAFALQLYFLTAKCAELRLRLFATAAARAPLAAMLKVGALASVNSLCTLAAVIVITAFVARFGADTLAGFGIGTRLEFLIIPLVFGFGAASTTLVGASFGANQRQRAHRAGWTAALYSAVIAGLIGAMVALFPGIWASLFSDSEAVRAACREYLQIVGPFYAFYGVALCLYFASLGAGRVLWPVLSITLRVLIVLVGGLLLARSPAASSAHFYWLVAAGMLSHAFVTAVAIHLGAWNRGRDPKESSPVPSSAAS
jgi:putative MATE family efflux protein